MDFKIYRKIVLIVLSLTLMVLFSGCGKKQPELADVIEKTIKYQQETVTRPESASIGGEWTVISLVRSDKQIPDSYKEIYRTNLEKRLKETDGVLSDSKYTEYSRAILASAAIGEDPTDIAGYDLTSYLTDLDQVTLQGINGAASALLALDAGNYESTAREALLDWILKRELPNGGFALKEEEKERADADITAMVLQALVPYREESEIAAVIERGLEVLVQLQESDGSFVSWGEKSCETVSQVIIALSALGIDCEQAAGFTKEEQGLYDVLLTFYDGKGSFSHVPGGETDAMATDQALCALIAYQRFLDGKASFYDMTDLSK